MGLKHKKNNALPDDPTVPDEVRPSDWNDNHVFGYTLLTGAAELSVEEEYLATISTNTTFTLPTTLEPGRRIFLRNSTGSASTAVATLNPGAARTIRYQNNQSLALGEVLTCLPGENIELGVVSNAILEILESTAVGPQGPQGIQGIQGPQGPEGPQPPLSSATPAALGTAAAGTATAAARGDHVHPLPTPAAIGAAPTSHTHTASQISDSTVAGRSLLTAADTAAQHTALALGSAAQSATTAFAPSTHVGSGGAEHANATTSVAGFMSGADKAKLDGVATGATANAADAALRDRSTHTGSQAVTTTTFTATARFAGRTTAGAGATEELTAAQARTVLNVADGATANATDAALRDRATHTGTQPHTTITGLGTAATSAVADFAPSSHVGAGGAAHAAVTASVNGFMIAADKAKLDGVAAGATATPLSSTTPAALGVAAVGTGTTAARADHVHPMPTAAQVGADPAGTGASQAAAAVNARIQAGTVTGRYARWNQTTSRWEEFDLLGTANTWTAAQVFGGAAGSEGGEFGLQAPVTGTNLTGNVAVDIQGDSFRVFGSFAGQVRGFLFDFGGAPGGIHTLWHTGNQAQVQAGTNTNRAMVWNNTTGRVEQGSDIEDSRGNVRDIPLNVQNATYTFALADRGRAVIKNNTTAYTWTIPLESSVAFPNGSAITVINDSGTGAVTISPAGGVTLIAGATTGSFTLAVNESRTLHKVGTDRWRVL